MGLADCEHTGTSPDAVEARGLGALRVGSIEHRFFLSWRTLGVGLHRAERGESHEQSCGEVAGWQVRGDWCRVSTPPV